MYYFAIYLENKDIYFYYIQFMISSENNVGIYSQNGK